MADGTISIDVELNETAFKSSLENMGEIVKNGADLMVKSVNTLSGSFVLLPDTINSVMNTVPNIINGVINAISGKNPVMTQTGNNFFTSLINDMPSVISKISDSVQGITNGVFEKFIDFTPDMTETGSGFFNSLISNQPDIISRISEIVPIITDEIIQSFLNGQELISQTGFDLFCSLTNSLSNSIKEITKAPGIIVSALLGKFNGLIWQFKTVGENIVFGVWNGISSMGGWLAESVTGFFQGIINSVTGFLGISSPSKLFRDLVGKNIALGVKSGIDSEMSDVISDAKKQMSRLAEEANQSAKINFTATDIIGRANKIDMTESKSQTQNIDANPASHEINVILEPTGDIRGFFDYIRMGVKRSGYLNGEV